MAALPDTTWKAVLRASTLLEESNMRMSYRPLSLGAVKMNSPLVLPCNCCRDQVVNVPPLVWSKIPIHALMSVGPLA